VSSLLMADRALIMLKGSPSGTSGMSINMPFRSMGWHPPNLLVVGLAALCTRPFLPTSGLEPFGLKGFGCRSPVRRNVRSLSRSWVQRPGENRPTIAALTTVPHPPHHCNAEALANWSTPRMGQFIGSNPVCSLLSRAWRLFSPSVTGWRGRFCNNLEKPSEL
jgi:hypothetical protein